MYDARLDDETVSVQVCCRSAINPNSTYCGKQIGSGKAKRTNIVPGEFDYLKLKVYVLYTDYDDQTIVYGCRPTPPWAEKDEMIYVLSRDCTLSSALTTRAFNVLKNNGIDFLKAKPVRQGAVIPCS